jgi:hypothetical protein
MSESLSVNTHVSHYRILSKLGAGIDRRQMHARRLEIPEFVLE